MNDGFFSIDEASAVQIRKKTRTVFTKPRCSKCLLHKDCKSPIQVPFGKGDAGILIVGESPHKVEDQEGRPFVGPSGIFLRRKLKAQGINLDQDCILTNAINCRRKGEPTSNQIDWCRPIAWNAIQKEDPHLIILLGKAAVESVLGHRWGKENVGAFTKWRGWQAPDQELKSWICPLHHPDYVIRNSSNGPHVSETVFESDLEKALAKLDEDVPEYDLEKCVEVLHDPDDIVSVLKSIPKGAELAFDYETTGRKPEARGHNIVSTAISWDSEKAFSFLMDAERVRNEWISVLQNKTIGKIAHGLPFEERWSRVIYDCEVKNWIWCTRLAGHILDNRREVYGLKFQAYVRFGIPEYDTEIHPFLQSVEERDGNSLNRITNAPTEKLLYYGGVDALLTKWLKIKQEKDLDAISDC